jgi:hypothetical protein
MSIILEKSKRGVKTVLDLKEMTAKEIVNFVYQNIGRWISISLKDKKSIIKRAIEILVWYDYELVECDDKFFLPKNPFLIKIPYKNPFLNNVKNSN